MDFSLSADRQQIPDAIRKLCAQFDDGYWLGKDESGELPARAARGTSTYVAPSRSYLGFYADCGHGPLTDCHPTGA